MVPMNSTNAGCLEGYPKKGGGSLPDPLRHLHATPRALSNPANRKPFGKQMKYCYRVNLSSVLLKHLTLQPASLNIPLDLIL